MFKISKHVIINKIQIIIDGNEYIKNIRDIEEELGY